MAEELKISAKTKTEKYADLLPQIKALVSGEPNLIANLANIAAALRQTFNWFWVGFYLVEQNELVLGPFQGDIACTRIAYSKGVCGKAWADKATIIVDNVDEFPNHIACSTLSKSEIVVPILKNGKVRLVLDVDSNQLNNFDSTDQQNLETLASFIENLI
ncbi:MAG: GAF domain-containing protein [Crocinitomicaceae bacterium]